MIESVLQIFPGDGSPRCGNCGTQAPFFLSPLRPAPPGESDDAIAHFLTAQLVVWVHTAARHGWTIEMSTEEIHGEKATVTRVRCAVCGVTEHSLIPNEA